MTVIASGEELGSNHILYHCRATDIIEISELEEHIKRYLDDFSLLLPSWYCDDVL